MITAIKAIKVDAQLMPKLWNTVDKLILALVRCKSYSRSRKRFEMLKTYLKEQIEERQLQTRSVETLLLLPHSQRTAGTCQ